MMARPVRPIRFVLNVHNIKSSITGKCFYFEVQSPSIHTARMYFPDARLGLWFSYVVFPVFLAVFCWYLYLAQDYMRHSLTPNLMLLYCQMHEVVSWTFRLSKISPQYSADYCIPVHDRTIEQLKSKIGTTWTTNSLSQLRTHVLLLLLCLAFSSEEKSLGSKQALTELVSLYSVKTSCLPVLRRQFRSPDVCHFLWADFRNISLFSCCGCHRTCCFLVVMLYERGFRLEVREKRTLNTREDSRAFILNLIDVYI